MDHQQVVRRIQEEAAGATVWCACVYSPCEVESSARNFHGAAISRLRAAAGGNASVILRRIVRPDSHMPSVAAPGRVSVDSRVRSDDGLRSVLLEARAMEISAHEHRATARITRRIDSRATEQANLVAEDLDRAASRAGLRTGHRQRAGVGHDTGGAAIENDFAIALNERVGANDSGVVDDRIEQRIRTARGEDDVAAIGFDAAAVDGGGVEG